MARNKTETPAGRVRTFDRDKAGPPVGDGAGCPDSLLGVRSRGQNPWR